MSDAEDADARIGTLVAGKYEIVRALGEGGMGAVYEAIHRLTRRRVAVKMLHAQAAASAEAVARFVQEAQAPSTVGHPGIVEVLDAGQENDGTLFLALEYLDGHDLAAELAVGPASVGTVVHVTLALLDILAEAHARGFVHRDIKPQNVFLARDGRGGVRIKLLDFGIARRTDGAATGLTMSGAILGTPLYMSPEQARGERVDGRSDLWSLGAMMFRALTGRAPFLGENYNLLIVAIVTTRPPSIREFRPDLPEALIDVVDRALSHEASSRWQSAQEMAAALGQLRRIDPPSFRLVGAGATREPVTPADALLPTVDATPASQRAATPLAFARLQTDETHHEAPPEVPSRSPRTWWIAGLGVALVGAAVAFAFARPRPPLPSPARVTHGEAPRPIAPSSLSVVGSRRPTFRWSLPRGLDAAALELCRDRACARSEHRAYVSGTSWRPDQDLDPGMWFWRLRGLAGGQSIRETSPAWSFTVRARDGHGNSDGGAMPDVNGDGLADLLIGAPDTQHHLGRVALYAGTRGELSQTPATTLDGLDGENGYFGHDVASAGDVNGDGFDDVIVGAPEVFNRAGRAYVFLGSSAGLADTPAGTIGLDDPEAYVGAAVAGIGDVNGDGFADVAAGAYGADHGAGRVLLFWGSARGIASTPSLVLEAPDGPGSEFGVSLASAGDLNGDGFSDVVIGARGTLHETGRAYVYLGNAAGLSESPALVLSGSGEPGARFGERVAGAGDVNGDGFDDIAIAAPRAFEGSGRVYVFHGKASSLDAEADAILEAPDHGALGFGGALAGGGDPTHDGIADLIIGAPRAVSGRGTVWLFAGSSTGLAATPTASLEPDGSHDGFGTTVAQLGDVNGDGIDDLAVGALGRDGTAAVFVYSGTGTTLMATLPVANTEARGTLTVASGW